MRIIRHPTLEYLPRSAGLQARASKGVGWRGPGGPRSGGDARASRQGLLGLIVFLLGASGVLAGDLTDLAKRLDQGSLEEKKATLAEIAKQGGLDAARLILSRADVPDLRYSVRDALSEMTDAETTAWLCEKGLSFPSAPVRACVVRTLAHAARSFGQPVPDAVLALSKDADPDVRAEVALATGAGELLHDPAWQVRLGAYLGTSGEGVRTLLGAMSDPDLTVQRTVEAALPVWPGGADALKHPAKEWKPPAGAAPNATLPPLAAVLKGRAGERKGPEEAAIRAACIWLARHQEADGRWSCSKNNPWTGGIPFPDFVEEDRYVDAAVTGLAVLVMLGDGCRLDGDFGAVARRGIDYLLRCQAPNGKIDSAPTWAPSLPGAASPSDPNPHPANATTFNHTIGTLALVEAYAMSGDKALQDPAQRALDQLFAGEIAGYQPWGPYLRGEDSAPSVFAIQAIALARVAGLRVEPQWMEMAKKYVQALTDPDTGRARFRHVMPYCLGGYDGAATLLASRAFLGMSLEGDTSKGAFAFLQPHRPNWNAHFSIPRDRPRSPADRWRNDDDILNFWYFRFASEAWRAKGGAEWDAWWKDLCAVLLPAQRIAGDDEGSWDPEGAWSRVGGRVYSTCFCALALETPFAYDVSALR